MKFMTGLKELYFVVPYLDVSNIDTGYAKWKKHTTSMLPWAYFILKVLFFIFQLTLKARALKLAETKSMHQVQTATKEKHVQFQVKPKSS